MRTKVYILEMGVNFRDRSTYQRQKYILEIEVHIRDRSKYYEYITEIEQY